MKVHFIAPKHRGLKVYDDIGLVAAFDDIGNHGDLWTEDKNQIERLRKYPTFNQDFFELDPNAPVQKPKSEGSDEVKAEVKAELSVKYKTFHSLSTEILNKNGNIKADAPEEKVTEYESLKTELGL